MSNEVTHGGSPADWPAGADEHRPWLRSILSAIHEGMLVLDPAGQVLLMNRAFTELLGYHLTADALVPPYPWWPSEAEDEHERKAIASSLQAALSGVAQVTEFRFFDEQRRPVWVASADAHIRGDDGEVIALVRTFRDITRQKEAQRRRAEAVQVAVDLAAAEELESVLSVGQHGFETLFDGGSTTQLDLSERYLFSGGRPVTSEELAESARKGLSGTTSADATNPRPGLLLVPQTSTTPCRIWIQFRRPRRIDSDEMIAADLFAQAFGLAVDRVVLAQELATSRNNLQEAIASHRYIGHAVGILVERYRTTPAEAFQRLRSASQNRNIKLREIARRMIESGEDPERV